MTDTTPSSPTEAASFGSVQDMRAHLAQSLGARDDAPRNRFDALRDGLARGRFGGCPVEGPAAKALVILLELLDWQGTIDEFARAMPHFPQHFDFQSMRETLARLGYLTEPVKDSGHLVYPLLLVGPKDSIRVIGRDGTKPVFVAGIGGIVESMPNKMPPGMLFQIRRIASGASAGETESWFLGILRRMRGQIGKLFLLSFTINLSVLLTSLGVVAIYDLVIPSQGLDTLLGILLGVMFAFVFEMGFRRIKARMIGRLTGRIEYLIATDVFAKVLSLPLERTAGVAIGSQMSRLAQFEGIRELVSGYLANIVLELPLVLTFLGILLAFSPPLGVVTLIILAIYLLIAVLIFPELRQRNREATPFNQMRQALILETVSNLRAIRSASFETVWAERLAHVLQDSAIANRRAARVARILRNISQTAFPVTNAVIILVGSLLVMNGALTTGVLIAATIVISRVMAPIQQAFLGLSRFSDLLDTLRQIDQMMRLRGTQSNREAGFVRRIPGSIEVEQLYYRYSSEYKPALSGINLSVKPGEMIAIMGPSGAGKTTLLRLFLHLLTPLTGTIRIGGFDTRQIPDADLRTTIGYMPSKPALFHGTIAQNLRLVAPDATDDDLLRVLDEVGLTPIIEGIPTGLATLLDQAMQEKLPSVFRQAFALAQVLLANTPILLIDKPNPGFDEALERRAFEALSRRKGLNTIVVVTHSPAVALLADRVLVLNGGQIVAFDQSEQVLNRLNGVRGAA